MHATNLALRANLSYDRFVRYVETLIRVGLVERDEETMRLTSRGHEFLGIFQRWTSELARFGLYPLSGPPRHLLVAHSP